MGRGGLGRRYLMRKSCWKSNVSIRIYLRNAFAISSINTSGNRGVCVVFCTHLQFTKVCRTRLFLIGFANVHAAFVVCRTALIPSEVARDRAGVSRLTVPKKNDQGRICNQTQIVNTDKDVAIRTPEAATRLARL